MERKRQALDARIAALRTVFAEEEAELKHIINQERNRESQRMQDQARMAKSRIVDE